MLNTVATPKAQGLALLLGWRRVFFTLGVASVLALLFSTFWKSSIAGLFLRVHGVSLLAMLAFGLFEQWPNRLPKWLARWALQVLAVAVIVPVSLFVVYTLSTLDGRPPFWRDELRLSGFSMLTVSGLLLAPWVALGALVRQREALARNQALAFELERSELERNALDARMRVLQAQVQPHFLFNTLANVRALVNAGSPRAPAVLDSLIEYLRAAVPRLSQAATTMSQEAQLARAYLELMHLRMPDRLQFTLAVDEAAMHLQCPPMTLLTLVENAVRHGIDPAEDGGRIDVQVQLRAQRCQVIVTDTGVGLRHTGGSLGTGLTSLRERLHLNFGGDAGLRVSEGQPRGVCVELDFPARRALA